MSEPFIGEIRMFAGNFAPRGWAFCDGQLLAVSQNDALFSLVGTIYGGDGRTTFALPDMRGRIPIHSGMGPGLSEKRLGSKDGAEDIVLTTDQMPNHTHEVQAAAGPLMYPHPQGNMPARSTNETYRDTLDNPVVLNSATVSHIGGSRSHSNLMPYLCIHFIIALIGIYPSRH